MQLLRTLWEVLHRPDFYALSLGHGPALLVQQQPAAPGARGARDRARSIWRVGAES